MEGAELLQFQNGKGYADLVNLLTDGTVPKIDLNDTRENIRNQSAYVLQLIGTGVGIMQQEEITAQSALWDIYGSASQINLKAGGNGGAFYQNLQSIFNSVKSFIGDQINLQIHICRKWRGK